MTEPRLPLVSVSVKSRVMRKSILFLSLIVATNCFAQQYDLVIDGAAASWTPSPA